MLISRQMGRGRKSNNAAIAEAACYLLGILMLAFIISPAFRVCAVVIAGLLVGSLAVNALYLGLCKTISLRPLLSPFRTTAQRFTSETPPSFGTSTTGAVLQSVQFIPEPTISEKLRKIDWFQFEKLIELIYEHRGFFVKRLGGANPDGGVDLIIESPTEKFVVQCKHWRKRTVGVRHIREFLGTLTDSGIPKGIFITLVGYSADAKTLADKHGIQILDEPDIVVMLVESGLIDSKEISNLFSDDRKFCPKCEKEMELKTARVSGNQFWGCSNYPNCRYTLDFHG